MDQQSDFWSSMEAAYSDFKEGLNGVLFAMSKDSTGSKLGFTLSTVIDSLQMMAFAIPTPESLQMNFPPPVVTLSHILSYLKFGNYAIDVFGPLPSVTLFLTLVTLQLVNLAYVGNAWAKREFHVLWPIKLLRYTMKTFVGVLYIPIVSVLSTVFSCSGFSSQTECTILFPFVVTVLVAFVGIGIIANVTLFDPRPTSSHPAARPHSRIHVMQLATKTFLSILFPLTSTIQDEGTKVTVWSTSVVILTVPLAFLFTWYQPYFHRSSTLGKALLSSLQAWFAVCAFAHVEVVFGQDLIPASFTTLTVFGGTFLILPMTWFAVHFRWYTLSNMPVNKCSGVFEFELRARIELQTTNPYAGDLRERAEIVHDWYMEMAKKFPFSSSLHVFHAYMILDYLPERPTLVRRAILLAERNSLRMDFAFIVYKTRKTLEEESGSFNVIRLVKSDFLLQEATQFDRQCSLELVEFWNELSQRKPNVEKIRNLTRSIAANSALARQRYNELLLLDPHSTNTLKRLGSFLMDVINDTQTAQRLLKKASHMETNVQMDVEDRLNQISSDSVGVLLVRGGKVQVGEMMPSNSASASIGEITKANAQAGRLVNEVSSNLLGKQVQSFLIPPLSQTFSEMMRDFIALGKDQIFETRHKTFLRTKDDTLLPVNMRFKPHLGENSEFLVYIIFADIDTRSDSRTNFALFTDFGDFVGASQDFMSMFFMHIEPVKGPNQLTNSHRLQPQKVMKELPALLKRGLKRGSMEVDVVFEETSGQVFLRNDKSIKDKLPELVEGSMSFEQYRFFGSRYVQVFFNFAIDEESDLDAFSEGDGRSDSELDMDLDDELNMPSLSRQQSSDQGVRIPDVRIPDGENIRPHNAGSKARLNRIASKASSVESVDRIRKKAIEVRRMLVQNTKLQMDPILRSLRRMYFRATLLMMVVSVGELLYCKSLIDEFDSNVDFIGHIGFRRTLALQIAFAAHSLILIKQNILPTSLVEENLALLKFSAETLKERDAEMFYLRDQIGSKFKELYETPSLEFITIRENISQSESISLYDGVLRLSSLAMQAHSQPLDHFEYSNEVVFPLLTNVIQRDSVNDRITTSVLEGLETSTDLYTEYVRNSLNSVLVTFEALSITLCVLTTLSLLIAIHPLIGNGGKIESTKREVLKIFEGIPKRISREVAERFVQRLADVHGETVDHLLENEINKTDETAAYSSAKSISKSRKAAKAASDLHNKQKNRPCKSISLQKIIILGKMASLLFASMVYFFALIFLITKTNSSLQGAPSTANLAGFRRTRSMYVTHEIRLLLSGAFRGENGASLFDPEFHQSIEFAATPESVRLRVANLLATHDAIMYGSAADFITGAFHEKLSTSASALTSLLNIYSVDGCLNWPTTATKTEAACKEFSGGIMASGLHNALIEYGMLVEDMSYKANKSSNHSAYFDSNSVQRLIEFEGSYLQTQLNTVIGFHSDVNKSIVDRESRVMVGVTVAFLVSAVLCYFLIVRRVLFRLDLEVKRTRALLLVIPEDLFYSLGDIQRFLLEQFGNFPSLRTQRTERSSSVLPS